MLHPLNKNPDYKSIMENLVEFQSKVLEFVCDGKAVTELRLQRHLGDEAGSWLYEKMINQRTNKKNDFGKAVDKLIDYFKTNTTQKTITIAAFQNDVDFHNHYEDNEYSFSFNRLPHNLQKLLKPVFGSFYEWLQTGYPSCITGFDEFKRENFVNVFWENNGNLKVCPACDAKIEKVRERHASPVDHHFPKSAYPFLSVHWNNLIPNCSICNSDAKLSYDPLKNLSLFQVFHPYERPALDNGLEIKVEKITGDEQTGELEVKLYDEANPACRRVEPLTDVYDLPGRWTDRLRVDIIVPFLTELNSSKKRRQEEPETIEESMLRQDLIKDIQKKINNAQSNLGAASNKLLERAYFTLLSTDSTEFEDAFKQFC